MKKLSLLLTLLALLLCSCLSADFSLPGMQTTAVTTEETTPTSVTEPITEPTTDPTIEPTTEPITEPGTAPEETAPKETTPEETTPEETAPEETTPEETTPEETIPEETTPEETKPEETTPEETISEETISEETTPEETTPEVTTPEETTPEKIPHEHLWGESVITKQPTCVESGEKVAICTTCDATQKTTISATGIHIYENGICSGCNDAPIPLYAVPSVYDADGDGRNDVYNFSPKLLDAFQNGIHVWAKDYLPGSKVSTTSEKGIQHWYVTENQSPAQFIVYSVTVPETGQYEMVIHLRMKDAQERGTKYTVNAGTKNEYTFETSFGHTGLIYTQLRDINTYGTYMYGIKVNLVAGENTIKIEQSSMSPKCQHYRDFYFVKTGDFHIHKYENETVTKHVTCATDGEKVATCSCGKTRVTVIPATENHIYENETVTKQVTCGADGEKVATCSCGKTRVTVIPATRNHIYENDICTGCGKVYVPAGILEYNFLYDAPGFAGGTLTFLPETSDVYTFYWADANGKLKDYTMLYSDEFVADVEAEVTIQSFTAIPKGATRLLAVSGDGDVVYSYTIPKERLFTEEELYTFGAISDTHQGTRYGSTSIPYNHFINAAKVLYDKGAITVGICGDFSYDNIESEYILHAEAIQEIYQYAPDMPIFTTSGNHESKYTGFSYDWYMEYTRDVVDYDSDLTYSNFGKDNIDYVVELPDGSVMIYLHQLYYDYGNSTSRLLDDHQLEWFEERLEEYKDRTVFLFFHTFMDEQVGDATSSGNEYGLPMISSTVEYKKFDELFKKYKNVVYFSGHSHWAFDSQLVEAKPGKTNDDKNIDNKDGTYATMVHIPACSTPRVLVGSGDGRSEGYIVHVYENYVVFEGYEFVQGETFAYATFIIEK